MKKKSKKAKNQTKTKRKKEKREQLFTVISNGVEGKAVAQDVFPAWKRCTVWGFFAAHCAPNVSERAGAAPLAFAVGVWGQCRGWQWPWCHLPVPCSEGISELEPQSKALLPYRLWTDSSSLDCHKKTPQKTLGKLCQERPQFLCQPSLVQPPLRESSESLTNSQIFGHYSFKLLSVKE